MVQQWNVNRTRTLLVLKYLASYYLTTITLSYHSKPYLYKDLAVVTLCITKLNILYLWSDIVTCTNSDAEIAGASPGASEDRRVRIQETVVWRRRQHSSQSEHLYSADSTLLTNYNGNNLVAR